MPILRASSSSPASPSKQTTPPTAIGKLNAIPRAAQVPFTRPSPARNENAGTATKEVELYFRRVPVVRLDVDVISDGLAGNLACALLGHVLFLKNQVPLPIMQLARLSNTQRTEFPNNTRAAKQRKDLIDSFDTLASHLNTTFTALATAFARCRRLDGPTRTTVGSDRGAEDGDGKRKTRVRTYLAILVGPGVASARAQVLLGVDGLETKVWGEREDGGEAANRTAEGGEEEDDQVEEEEDDEDASEGEEGEESDFEEETTSEEEEEIDGTTSENEEQGLEDVDEREATPPPSSPSPSPSPSSPATPKTSSESIPASAPSSPTYFSHAQQQQALLAAERLLSRTLALADADGYGLASEMAPTQTHVLIRAPRRFSHPAWTPKQNVTASMEKMLGEFLEDSGASPSPRQNGSRSRSKKAGQKRVEGVWVVGRGSVVGQEVGVKNGDEGDERDEDEHDEMIWWSWDGKLAGFSDW